MAYMSGDPRERSISILLVLILLSLFGLILSDVVRLGVQQAEAQEAPAPTTYEPLLAGMEHYRAGQYEQALVAFQKAAELL